VESAAKGLVEFRGRTARPLFVGSVLRPDRLQLAGVQPMAAAFGALVHDDPALYAGEVAHHHHARVLRTVQALAQVDNDVWISLDLEQALTGRLVGFVNL